MSSAFVDDTTVLTDVVLTACEGNSDVERTPEILRELIKHADSTRSMYSNAYMAPDTAPATPMHEVVQREGDWTIRLHRLREAAKPLAQIAPVAQPSEGSAELFGRGANLNPAQTRQPTADPSGGTNTLGTGCAEL
jgi:hypothetical protein